MRTALRTSIVTAALAGAVFAPLAGSAFAAPVAAAPVTAVPQTAATADDDRYEGEVHAIGQGMVAVLRNKEEGPEAWIRWVGHDWKPGDPYMVSVVAKLDRTRTSDKVGDVYLELTEAESAEPVLVVTRGGVAKSYPLPKASPPPADKCVSRLERVDIGEGSVADLTMSPEGPKAVAHSADPSRTWSLTLTRTDPTGRDVRIVNPSGAHPVFEWSNPQGGVHVPLGKAYFPGLPQGCKLNYKVQEDAATPVPQPTASAAPTTAAPMKPQTAGQTSVVPKGPVAAGAELPVETAADTGNTATMTAGAALIAAFGALGASVVLRRRRPTRG
ncbi:hypothetical protein [Streptomyces sp. 147326]|uniref:hypothetical protein n=1 Tax=Streptomyces sp. 147326 TaxID=3074379 RepID=UPI003857299F